MNWINAVEMKCISSK